jgi:PIN domain nuclease of toxin-antitoxin system
LIGGGGEWRFSKKASVLPARWRSWLQNAKSSKTAAQHQNGLVLEPVTLKDILALSALPALHRDPFDRFSLR